MYLQTNEKASDTKTEILHRHLVCWYANIDAIVLLVIALELL